MNIVRNRFSDIAEKHFQEFSFDMLCMPPRNNSNFYVPIHRLCLIFFHRFILFRRIDELHKCRLKLIIVFGVFFFSAVLYNNNSQIDQFSPKIYQLISVEDFEAGNSVAEKLLRRNDGSELIAMYCSTINLHKYCMRGVDDGVRYLCRVKKRVQQNKRETFFTCYFFFIVFY